MADSKQGRWTCWHSGHLMSLLLCLQPVECLMSFHFLKPTDSIYLNNATNHRLLCRHFTLCIAAQLHCMYCLYIGLNKLECGPMPSLTVLTAAASSLDSLTPKTHPQNQIPSSVIQLKLYRFEGLPAPLHAPREQLISAVCSPPCLVWTSVLAQSQMDPIVLHFPISFALQNGGAQVSTLVRKLAMVNIRAFPPSDFQAAHMNTQCNVISEHTASCGKASRKSVQMGASLREESVAGKNSPTQLWPPI